MNITKIIFRGCVTFWRIASLSLLLGLVACGGGDSGSTDISTGTALPSLALFAGNLGGAGNSDGIGAAASFFAPRGAATDSVGNVYVTDFFNHTIRKITPAGVVSTLAGVAGVFGSADGTGAAARFYYPWGVASDSAGNVYVADAGNSTLRKITPTGVVSTLAGTAGSIGSADGIGAAARFYDPRGVATDSAGNVYVVDCYNHTIRKITPAGVVSTLAGAAGVFGNADGAGAAASFYYPQGVATDSLGNVYVTDTGNSTLRKITPAGVVSTFGAVGLFASGGVATDSMDNVYVVDTGNSYVLKITPAGVVSTLAGVAGSSGSADGTGIAARFDRPAGVATDSTGNVYVVDTDNHILRKITPAGLVSTLAGTARVSGSVDGIGALSSFNQPLGVATDSAGNVYVADYGNHTIRKITSAGVVSTFAGTAGRIGSADGTGAAASFYGPRGLATDSTGNVYVADTNNRTVRKITPEGMVVTLAGAAAPFTTPSGSADGTGTAARFSSFHGVATDSAGNVYVADTDNHTIRKITAAGVVSTLAGSAGNPGSADGIGAAALFNYPGGVATDHADNIYVTDANNTLRKITPAGVVSTLVGVEAGLIAIDSVGNIYVVNTGNNIVRKITLAGVVSTLVGREGQQGGFVAGALPGVLEWPRGVAVQGTSLYITLRHGVAVVTNLP